MTRILLSGPDVGELEERYVLDAARSGWIAPRGPGDAIPTSTLAFAATADAITYTGATPDLVDCDAAAGNIGLQLLDDADHPVEPNRPDASHAVVSTVDLRGG